MPALNVSTSYIKSSVSIEQAYTISTLTPGNLGALKSLFKDAFGSDVADEVLQKRFSTAALGMPVVGFIAIDKITKEIAAYYGVFPVKLVVDGGQILAAQSGDTMTHSAHRKKGLFVYLAQRTFDACREKGIVYIFGMPNANSYPGFTTKLGWICIDQIAQYHIRRKWKTIPLRKLAVAIGKPGLFDNWARRKLLNYSIPPPSDFSNIYLGEDAKVLRDEHYLNYKKSRDKYFISVAGVKVWIKLCDTFWIGDFDDYSKVTEQTIEQIKRIAFRIGYNTIRFHLNETTPVPFLKWLTKTGSEPLCCYSLQPKYKNIKPLLTAADFDTW